MRCYSAVGLCCTPRDYLLEGRDFDSESVDEFNRISRYYRIASAHGNAKYW